MTELKENELDGPAAEITRIVKRSGAFDNIKKSAIDELQMLEQVQVQSSLMFSVMKVLFEQQNRSTKGVMSLSERRMQLKDNIRKGSMYKSLTNYFQESDAYKDACDRLAEEVDRVVGKHYPAYKPSEPCTSNLDIMPSLQLPDVTPAPASSGTSLFAVPPPMNLSGTGFPPPMIPPSEGMPPPLGLPLPPISMMTAPPPLPIPDMGSLPMMGMPPLSIPSPAIEPNSSYESAAHVKAEVVDTTIDNTDHMDMELDSGSSRAASPVVMRIKEEIVNDSDLPPPPMPPPSL